MKKKKIIALVICCGVLVSFCACGAKKTQDNLPQNDTNIETNAESEQNGVNENNENNSNQNESNEAEGIENGGDIGDIDTNNAPSSKENTSKSDSVSQNTPSGNKTLAVERDENGNITEQSAILILQSYSTEQLGLTPNVEYQLLFDDNKTDINGTPCYTIAAKKPGENTEGVFYVALDASAAYKYDIDNAKYIKLP